MITTETVTAGNQFAYTTAFAPMRTDDTKVRINTIAFQAEGAVTSWSLVLLDEQGEQRAVVLADTTTSFYVDGVSLGPLPVTPDGNSYQLGFTTVGLVDGGTLTIDHQVVLAGAT